MIVMPINGEVLKWARKIRRVTLDAAAKKLNWEPSHLESVEAGDVQVTDTDLEALAKAYRLPLATLLMPAPLPVERYGERPLTDFRLHKHGRTVIGIETQRYVEDSWELLELMVDLGETIALPEYSLSDDATAVAAAERQRIGVTVEEQLSWKKERDAYLTWRARLEDEGIVVHALNIKEDDIRGFALQLGGACLITINKNEPKDRAKVYSLIHEYAHLLLRCNGFSDQNRSVPVERWCNQFAANFLLPADAVRSFFKQHRLGGGQMGDYQVNRVASAFKVSNSATAIRFEELGLASEGFYERLSSKWQKPNRKSGFDPEGDQVKTNLNRYGVRHVALVLRALDEGRINRVEARYALNVNPRYHEQMMSAARERQQVYGRQRAG